MNAEIELKALSIAWRLADVFAADGVYQCIRSVTQIGTLIFSENNRFKK